MANGRVGLGSGQVKQVVGQKRVIFNGLKTGSGQLGCKSGWPVFFAWFSLCEENMYLLFGKSCNKLLDIKYITLNSLLISRMNSVKLINTYSIILKLYKAQHC